MAGLILQADIQKDKNITQFFKGTKNASEIIL